MAAGGPEPDAAIRGAAWAARGQALAHLAREFGGLTVAWNQAAAERLGLTLAEHKAADLIERYGPLTAGALAERTGLSTAGVTKVVDRLEALGLVRRERDPDDRRSVRVYAVPDPARDRAIYAVFDGMQAAVTAQLAAYDAEALAVVERFVRESNAILSEQTARLRAAAHLPPVLAEVAARRRAGRRPPRPPGNA